MNKNNENIVVIEEISDNTGDNGAVTFFEDEIENDSGPEILTIIVKSHF